MSSAGIVLLRQALGQVHSAVTAIEGELELADQIAPDRLPSLIRRARSLSGIARDAVKIADEALLAMAGEAPPVPSLCPEDAAKGSGRHSRPETEPGEETDPGSAW